MSGPIGVGTATAIAVGASVLTTAVDLLGNAPSHPARGDGITRREWAEVAERGAIAGAVGGIAGLAMGASGALVNFAPVGPNARAWGAILAIASASAVGTFTAVEAARS